LRRAYESSVKAVGETESSLTWNENNIRNDNIGEMLDIESVEEAASRSRLRWFGHVHRINENRLPKSILNTELPGRRGRGRLRRR